jgi:hypothetical protein
MPDIGRVAFLTFAAVTTAVAYHAASLRPQLQGRRPCRRWFAFLAGTVAAALVFATWTWLYGLGAAEPDLGGAAFGLFGGLVWGGIFSYFNTRVLWRAFDPPTRDYAAEYDRTMHTDIGVLIARAARRVWAFRPVPEFARVGKLPWSIFAAAVVLPVIWAYAFCLLVWTTEGAPGVKPVMPLNR